MRAQGDRGRGPRPSRAESEDLLDGGGDGPLRELLAAVSAPAHREETVGEAAATSAFVAARRGDAPGATTAREVSATGSGAAGHPVRAARWWRAPTRFVAALALALATAGVAVGAVAVLRAEPPAAPPASSIPAPAAGGGATVGPGPLPEGDRIANCAAWRTAGASSATVRAADPAFAGLISAAGGVANVDGFCAATSAPAVAPTTPGSVGEPRVTTSSTAPSARTSREGAARGADAPGASPERGADRGDAAGGRSVGPPATPPGRAPDRDGPAAGRSVGPPTVPPGQGRAQRNDGATPRGQG